MFITCSGEVSASPSDGIDGVVGWERTVLPPRSSRLAQRPVCDRLTCSSPCTLAASHIKAHFCDIVLCLKCSRWAWPASWFSFTFKFCLQLYKKIISTHGFSVSLAKMCMPVYCGQGSQISEIASLPLNEEPSPPPDPLYFSESVWAGIYRLVLSCEQWGLCPSYSALPREGGGSHRQWMHKWMRVPLCPILLLIFFLNRQQAGSVPIPVLKSGPSS